MMLLYAFGNNKSKELYFFIYFHKSSYKFLFNFNSFKSNQNSNKLIELFFIVIIIFLLKKGLLKDKHIIMYLFFSILL